MTTFNNLLVSKGWGATSNRLWLGSVKVNAPNEFYGSDTYDAPVAELSRLRKNRRCRYLYEEDYPVYRKRPELVSPEDPTIIWLDIENLGGIYKHDRDFHRIRDFTITCASVASDPENITTLTENIVPTLAGILSAKNVIITGWNVEYDISLITDHYMHATGTTLNITCPVIDYMSLYRTFIRDREESFRLDHILRVNGLAGKVEYDEVSLDDLAENNWEKYLEYNRRDVLALMELEDKLHLFRLAGRMREISGCLWQDILSKNAVLESYIYRWLRQRGMTFRNSREITKVPYQGGSVIEPKPGIYHNLYCFDFASLYPSIILADNIGPDTVREENGRVTFDRSHPSFIAEIERELLSERARFKKGGDHVSQWAFKILANSLYGVFGTTYFRFADPRIASAITRRARHLAKHVGAELDRRYAAFSKKRCVIYGDTDSLYIDVSDLRDDVDAGEHLDTAINRVIIPEYEEAEGLPPGSFSMKDEYGRHSGVFFPAKKRYCLKIGDRLKIVGFERSDALPKGKEWFRLIMEAVMNGEITSWAQIEAIIERLKDKFTLHQDYLIPYRINKPITEYKKREHWMDGIDNLRRIYRFNGDITRGVLIELIGGHKTTATGRKSVLRRQTTLAVPEQLYPLIGTLVGYMEGWEVDRERHYKRLFSMIYSIKEVFDGAKSKG